MMKTFIILSCMAVICLSLPFPLFDKRMLAETMRRAIDETLSKRTTIEISEKTFNNMDIGGDGHIDADDYATFVLENIPGITYKKDEIKGMFVDSIGPIDKNGNGMVELEEMCKQFLEIGLHS